MYLVGTGPGRSSIAARILARYCARTLALPERKERRQKMKEARKDWRKEGKKGGWKWMADIFVCALEPSHPHDCPSLCLQLRVIRAFKSTLEDLEERRSVHSLHSLHSLRSSRSHTGPRPLSDISYIDEDPVKTPSPLNDRDKTNNSLMLPKMVSPAEDPHLVPTATAGKDVTAGRGITQSTDPPPLTSGGSGSGLLAPPHAPAPHRSAPQHLLHLPAKNNHPQRISPFQPLSPAHLQNLSPQTLNSSGERTPAPPGVPDLPKLVHETSI